MYKTITLMYISTIFIFTSSTHQTQTPLYTRRRILHQPFSFSPQITTTTPPPTISPNPQPENQPKYPFSSLSPSTSTSDTDSPSTFFPLYTTPPPPQTTPTQPTTTPTFPANISSLILTNTSHNSKPISKKLIAIAVSLSLLSAFLVAVVATLLINHRRNLHSSVAKSDSLRLFPSNTAPSDAKPPGTLPVNEPASSSGGDDHNNTGASLYSGYQKLGSPELRPLPPLPKQNPSGEQFYYNDSRKGKQEEFFSPTGSPNAGVLGSGGLDSGSRSFNSRTASYPSSQSHSPIQAISTSPSIAFNSSPRSLTAKSPDSIVNFPAPLRPIPPPPTREPRDSLSPDSTQDSPLRVSDVSEVNMPPMPPPMPRPRVLEMAPENGGLVIEHPVLVLSSRGPVDSENRGQVCKSGEKNEEVLKLKLKPLHWDKVRASSDHAMVWDQLKSSSFQLNEEMIETLFMVNTSKVTPKDSSTPHPLFPLANQASQVLDPKKSQNIAILLRALNVTVGEVCEALWEGNGIAVYGCVAIPFK